MGDNDKSDIRAPKLNHSMRAETMGGRGYLAGWKVEGKQLPPGASQNIQMPAFSSSPAVQASLIAAYWLNLTRSQKEKEPRKCSSSGAKESKEEEKNDSENKQAFTRRLVDMRCGRKRGTKGDLEILHFDINISNVNCIA